MFIQIILTVWLLALIFLTNKFRRENRVAQQRIFSFFLILWSILGIIYYDVWTITSGLPEQTAAPWQTYLPAAFFSICAGLGTYYLMMTFGKFRVMAQKNQREADQQAAKKKKPQAKKSANGKQTQRKR